MSFTMLQSGSMPISTIPLAAACRSPVSRGRNNFEDNRQ